MVNNQELQLDRIFQALSDSTRRAMLAEVARGECMVSRLPNPARLSKAAISKHLNILERADLVERHREGRTIRCVANLKPIDGAVKLLEGLGEFWRARLDALDKYLTENEERDEIRAKSPSSPRPQYS